MALSLLSKENWNQPFVLQKALSEKGSKGRHVERLVFTQLLPQVSKALRLISSLGDFLWFTGDQLAVGWQMAVVVIQMDATLQIRPPLVMEGHHIPINSVGEAVELRNLERFRSQFNNAAFRFHDVNVERKDLHVRLCVGEPGPKYSHVLIQ